ncbi:serine/threonine-protein kinase [Actinomycetospora sp. CA-101289]|uniref:serine/threonine-protein kinase n=1 Tax=Actinomycetospora sp. CA-101289 TaxID=3239893 RepID=UPI003D9689FA
MADRNTQDLTGQRLGHFRVDGVIGRGGMSVLYRATDTRLGRRVALKVIDEALAADREFRERFVDEARNTSAIDHSHVVPLYDFDETDGHLYIAMRHVEGPDLASIIDGRPLTVARTLRLLGQVADALDAVHARGLVHLDVKPANVLVTTRESAGEHVYLADFGLTRRGATGHRTSGGDFLGSPTYAAPEHLRGEPVDARTDVYSLTCVLFTCLTGRAPYLGSVTEVIDGHLGGDVPSVAELAGLDPRIDEVVHRGMDPDRPRRHESASAVIQAARGALTGPGPAPLVGPPPARSVTGPPSGPLRPPGGPGGDGADRSAASNGTGPPAGTPPRGTPPPGRPGGPPPTPPRGAPGPGRPPSGPPRPPGPPPGPPGAPPPGPLTRSSVAPPMRLRDPVPPDRDGSFARAGAGPGRVLVIAGGLALLLLVVLLVLLLG